MNPRALDAALLDDLETLLRDPEGRRLFDELVARSRGRLEPPPTLSIVSPVYRAAGIVGELVRRSIAAARQITESFEIILVDDGSPDTSWAEIQRAGSEDPRVKGVRLSRNFGQHLAISAGLDHARGDWVVVLDCDLQDDPADIPRLFAKAGEGHDVVFAAHQQREHHPGRNLGARLFNLLLRLLAPGIGARPDIGTFSILSRRAADGFRQMGEVHRHYLGVIRWLGYEMAEVEVTHQPRHSGRSSYSFTRLLSHGAEGLVTQSNRLLHLAVGVGFVFLCASLLATAYLVVQYFRHGYKEGWPSTIVVILLSSSAILLAVGAVGIYIGKIFEQVKQRPLYLVRQRSNL